jgi:lactose/L-arabinose transport system permease protein
MSASRLSRGEIINGWLFLAPALALVGIFLLFPIAWSLWMSFQVGRGMNAQLRRLHQHHPPDPGPRVPARARQHDPLPGHPGADHAVLAALMAVALNDPPEIPRPVPHAIFLPCVTSLVAYSALFKSMFADRRVVNDMLMPCGSSMRPIPGSAIPSGPRS